MEELNDQESARAILLTAQSMLDGRTPLLEGVRKICKLRGDIDEAIPGLSVLVAVDSETDHLPVGSARALCSEDYIKAADEELQSYLSTNSSNILSACEDIVSELKKGCVNA
jgi:hypothetical protein